MHVNRLIEVRNCSPVHALRGFLTGWWHQMAVDALLAPVELLGNSRVEPQVIWDPAGLERVNPFAPTMAENISGYVHSFIDQHPGQRLAILLRPCELRTFVELRKQNQLGNEGERLITLGVDCLGTLPGAEYQHSVDVHGLLETTASVLRNAAEGGLRPHHFRNACQICDGPAPIQADIAIGTIGVPSDQFLLLIARDESVDAQLKLGQVAGQMATKHLVSHRETVVGAITDARAGVRKKLLEDLQANSRFNDLACLLALFANCSLCGDCLKACPLYQGEIDAWFVNNEAHHRQRSPMAELVSLSRWLASCSGCGMCEENCNRGVPLTLLVSTLSHRIWEEMHYRAGDPSLQPPWWSL